MVFLEIPNVPLRMVFAETVIYRIAQNFDRGNFDG